MILQEVECVEWFPVSLCWWGLATTDTGLPGSTRTCRNAFTRGKTQVRAINKGGRTTSVAQTQTLLKTVHQ